MRGFPPPFSDEFPGTCAKEKGLANNISKVVLGKEHPLDVVHGIVKHGLHVATTHVLHNNRKKALRNCWLLNGDDAKFSSHHISKLGRILDEARGVGTNSSHVEEKNAVNHQQQTVARRAVNEIFERRTFQRPLLGRFGHFPCTDLVERQLRSEKYGTPR